MPTQDTSQLKEKILSVFRTRGPCLPVHIARETGQSILFTSAFLSELVSDKKLKISNMKVGSTPVYFMPHQAPQLEKYSEHLKSKERDAYELLKKNKFLKDREQEPAIRVALRSIKDFAIPFESNHELIWRYFTVSPEEYQPDKKPQEEPKESPKQETTPEEKEKKDDLNIFDSEKEEEKESKKEETPKEEKKEKASSKTKKKSKGKKTSSTKQDKFFNQVKESLSNKGIEITDIAGFSRSDLTLKVEDKGEEKLLVAFNKKRVSEADIQKAYKKAEEVGLPYIILSKGEPTKKIQNLIEAIKSLSRMEEIE